MADPEPEADEARAEPIAFAAVSANEVVDFGVGKLELPAAVPPVTRDPAATLLTVFEAPAVSPDAEELSEFIPSPVMMPAAVVHQAVVRSKSERVVPEVAIETAVFLEESAEPVLVLQSPPADVRNVAEKRTDARKVEPYIPGPIQLPESPSAKRREVGFGGLLWAATSWSFGRFFWLIHSLFGIAALIAALAFVAAVPVVNLLALGYLLEVEGRVARSGKLRDAFHLVSTVAPRLGSIMLGTLACLPVLWLLSNAAADARIIEAGSFSDRALQIALPLASVAMVVHLSLAIASGGTLPSFLFPPVYLFKLFRRLRQGDFWARSEMAVSEFVRGFQLQHHFWLGLRGYVGAFLWLVIPTALFASARRTEGLPILVTVFGGLLLIIVLSWVPFLQAHFAAEDRFKAMFELGTVRRLFRKSPFMWLLSLTLTLASALPLYLAKVVVPPADGVWLVTPFFIMTIFPMKVLTGWAYHRAVARPKKAFFLWRWLCWMLMIPILGIFVFILFFTQFIGEHGKRVLFEHHAFLLPSPF